MRQRFENTITQQLIQEKSIRENDTNTINFVYKTKLKNKEIDLNNNPDIKKDDSEYESSVRIIGTDFNFKRKIVWFNAIGFAILHLMALYAVYLSIVKAKFYTNVWMIVVGFFAGEGVTMGAHRMWSHKSMKGTFIVRLVLLILQTIAGQNCLWVWARDHRLHHRYTDTDADPHNASRGFFFSHIGWLMSRKHPSVIEMGKKINMSDLEADELIMFQKKYYKTLYVIFAILIPVMIPVYFWNEDLLTSFFVSYIGRYILSLNAAWSVNSVAHLYGTKPFDKNIKPVESKIVSFLTSGEGWHNYHHSFPWDYKAAEYGTNLQLTTHIINALAKMGLVYDLKEAGPKLVENRVKRAGDGSHHN